ncbi:putative BAS1-transcription factor [Colletotrichum scovillei]|uniref:BAS1-transcription factor n=1 Tax=Colletotrichum scovillei TaxID=1209932 RepID=A0A9P7RFV7_9PEZI|nr:putative BAS1-transcription factor [Colletotrichum scovillei]KAG7075303.1 putative BAS1-transcription factor [Colletotrichum scovillei]KAG7082524.1 putative BAS1-transcription factor [Colletotrichum scovillei]
MGRSQMRSAVSTTEISFVHPVLEAALYVEHHYDPGCDLSIQKKPLPPTTRQTCSVAFMSVEDSSPCSPRVNATTRPRKIWTPEEDVTLKTLVARYGDARGPQGHWKDIAAALQDRTAKTALADGHYKKTKFYEKVFGRLVTGGLLYRQSCQAGHLSPVVTDGEHYQKHRKGL